MDPKAVGFAEEAIRALARKDVPAALAAVSQAHAADHSLEPLADAVYMACAQLEEEGRLAIATWNALADAVGPGPLAAVVEESRS